jgi:hypothetical protein
MSSLSELSKDKHRVYIGPGSPSPVRCEYPNQIVVSFCLRILTDGFPYSSNFLTQNSKKMLPLRVLLIVEFSSLILSKIDELNG